MRKKKVYDDEWKAKRVFTELDRKSKSTYSFKNTIGAYKNSVRKSNSYATKKPPKKQTEVVVKITGANRNFEGLKAHLRYISRAGNLKVETNTNEIFEGKENLKNLADSFNDYRQDIPTESFIRDNNLKEKREALHIVFSMRDIEYAPPSKIKESAMKTIDELYPNNHYVIVFHGDTDNPHCHLVLKVKDIYGKRINPKKSDLALMRVKFAENLRELNVEAKATLKNNINSQTNEFINDKPIHLKGDYKKSEHKPHHYEVINFGKAHYKFDTDNKMSYFVRYRTSKGKDVEIWADDLERVIEEKNIKKGEFVRFAITGETPVEIKIQDKKTNEWYQKTMYKKTWDASIEKRDEKILNLIKKFTPNDYKKIDEPMNTIVEFGEAKFNNDENNAISFFVTMQNHSGKKYTIWGKELKNLIEENELQIGSECLFEKETTETKTEKFTKTKWKVKTPQGIFHSSDNSETKITTKKDTPQQKQSNKEKEIE